MQAEIAKLTNDVTVVVAQPLEVPDQIDAIVSGQHQIALMNPLGFVFARERTNNVFAVAVAERIVDGVVGNTYFSQIYARKDLGIAPIDQNHSAESQEVLVSALRNKSLGFGVAFSTSNFLVPAFELLQIGAHPLTWFKSTEFFGGHDIIAKAVYNGTVQVGAGHDGVIKDLATQSGSTDAEEILITLLRSRPIPSDPVVINVDQELREVIQKALIYAGKTQAGKNSLAVFWGMTQGLAATDNTAYESLSLMLKSMSLKQNDILG